MKIDPCEMESLRAVGFCVPSGTLLYFYQSIKPTRFFFDWSLEFICSPRLFLVRKKKKIERVGGQTKPRSWIARVSPVRLANFDPRGFSGDLRNISQSVSFHSR